MNGEITGKEFGILKGTIEQFMEVSVDRYNEIQRSSKETSHSIHAIRMDIQRISDRLTAGDSMLQVMDKKIKENMIDAETASKNAVTAVHKDCDSKHREAIKNYIRGVALSWKTITFGVLATLGTTIGIVVGYIKIAETFHWIK